MSLLDIIKCKLYTWYSGVSCCDQAWQLNHGRIHIGRTAFRRDLIIN